MKHGEQLRAYSNLKNINVSRMARELQMDRSIIYENYTNITFDSIFYVMR